MVAAMSPEPSRGAAMSALPAELDPSTHGLEPLVADDELTVLPERAVAWEIDNVGAAEWALRHVAQLRRKQDAAKSQAAEWRAQIDAWEKGQLGRLGWRLSFFEER